MNIKRIIVASAIASLLFSGIGSVDAATLSKQEQLVAQAERYAGTLKWAISVEGSADGRTIPWTALNNTKAAYQQASTAVSKMPNGKTKTDLQARLEKNVNLYISTTPGKIGRAVAYIDAISAGKKIEAKKNLLDKRLSANIMDETTEKYYHDLSTELRKQSYLLDRVYGESTRNKIRSQFKGAAEAVKQKALYPVTIYMAMNELIDYLDMEYYDEAAMLQYEIEALFGEAVDNKAISTPMFDLLYGQFVNIQAEISKVMNFTFVDTDEGISITDNLHNGNEFLVDPDLLNSFDTLSFELYEEAKYVSVSILYGEDKDVYFDGENTYAGTVDLNDFKEKYNLIDLDKLEIEFYIVDHNGRERTEYAIFIGNTPYVFTDGKFESEFGYTIDVLKGYELSVWKDGSHTISSTNGDAGENWLAIETVDPDFDLTQFRKDAIEFLEAEPGTAKDYNGTDYFAGTDIKVKMHLIVDNTKLSEEVIVVEVDGELIVFTLHVDKTAYYHEVHGAFKQMMKSVSFN